MASPTDSPEVPINWHARVWRIALPIMLSNLAQPVVMAVDTAIAGHLPGPQFLAGVAVAVLLFGFVYHSFNFLRMSTTGLVAQAFGRVDGDALRVILARAGLLAAAIAAAILALQWPFREIGLLLVDAAPEATRQAEIYFDVRVWSAPATLGNYIVVGWLIGMQRTGWALVTQIVVGGANIPLSLFFVFGLDWQIAGLALGTTLAEYLGLAAGILVIARLLAAHPGRWARSNVLRRDAFGALLSLNRDLMIRLLALNFAFALFTALSARIGTTVLAANELLMNFLFFAACALDGYANAAEAIVGEAVGKARRATLRAAVRVTTLWAAAGAALASVIFLLAGPGIVDLLTDIPEVRETAYVYLPWAALLPLAGVWSYQLDGIFIGATRGRDMRNAMLESLALHTMAALALWWAFGNHGLWASLLGLFLIRAVTLAVRYPALERELAPAAAEARA